jgi:hypothetical protein
MKCQHNMKRQHNRETPAQPWNASTTVEERRFSAAFSDH